MNLSIKIKSQSSNGSDKKAFRIFKFSRLSELVEFENKKLLFNLLFFFSPLNVIPSLLWLILLLLLVLSLLLVLISTFSWFRVFTLRLIIVIFIPLSLACMVNIAKQSVTKGITDISCLCNCNIPLSSLSKQRRSFKISKAVLHDRFTSRNVSYVSTSFGSVLAFMLSVINFNPRNAVFNGVRSSCEM